MVYVTTKINNLYCYYFTIDLLSARLPLNEIYFMI